MCLRFDRHELLKTISYHFKKSSLINSYPGGEYLPNANLKTLCNGDLIKSSAGEEVYGKNKEGEYIYIPIKCPTEVSATDCYRRACNCDDSIDEFDQQPVSVRNGWECLPPVPLETFNTMFLSPSPMKYTIDKNMDQSQLNAKMDELEIAFKEKFVSFKIWSSVKYTAQAGNIRSWRLKLYGPQFKIYGRLKFTVFKC